MSPIKQDLCDSICRNCGMKPKVSARAVDSLFELMKSTLASGEDILITGFGKFSVNEKNPRNGRNPQTGNAIVLDARRVVTFKSSPVLRSKLNGNDPKA